MRRAAVVALLVLLAGCANTRDVDSATSTPTNPNKLGTGAAPASTSWTTKASFPEPRGEIACAALGSKIFAFGGYIADRGQSPRLDVYDLASDKWTRAPDAPVGYHHTQIVAYKGDLYVPGGYVSTGFQGANTFLKFSPATNQWSMMPLMPRPRGAHAAVVVEDELFAIGGRASSAEVYASVDVFNFSTNQWRSGPAMSVAREHVAAAVVGSEIFVVGGRPGTLNLTERLKPGDPGWTQVASMPTARSGLAASAWKAEVVVFGGEMPDVFEEAEGYDTQSETWRAHPPLPTPRHGLCAATLSDGIHVVAGGVQQGFSLSQHHEVLVFPS